MFNSLCLSFLLNSLIVKESPTWKDNSLKTVARLVTLLPSILIEFTLKICCEKDVKAIITNKNVMISRIRD